MRITILQGAFLPVPPLLGGAVEKIWFELGKQFAARGHSVTHVSRQHAPMPNEEEIEGVRHRRVRGFDMPASLVKLKLLDLVYTQRALKALPSADIIVTNTFWAPLLLGARHGRIYASVERFPKGQMKLYGKAARLRVPSCAVRDAVLREIGRSHAARVSMIPNPLPFAPPPAEAASKQKVILYAGRVHPEKGLDLLLDALRRLAHEPEMNGWSTEIVGPWSTTAGGGGEDYFRALSQRAQGLAVRFAGPVNGDSALREHYQRASIFTYPSLAEKGESFGLAPLEAMAHGCVPVVSGLACFKDFICPQINGLVFDHRRPDSDKCLAAAIRHLVTQAAHRTACSHSALEVNQSHASTRIAGLLLADFATLVH